MGVQKFRIKILDFKYLPDFGHLNFRYLMYEVEATHEKIAVKKARDCYMNGEKELSSEEIPILLKIFLIESGKL